MTPSTCSEDLLALQESSNENNSADQNVSPENQKLEIKRETPVDIQSNDAFFSTYEGSLMNDNNLGDPTEYINASHFPDQNTHYSEYDQNYANPNYLMNPYSTSMPSPAPAPVLLPTPISFAPEPNRPDIPAFNPNYIPTSIPLANQDTEIYPSNNNYANDDPLFPYSNEENELNDDDQAYIISTSEYHKNDYYRFNNPSPANSSDSLPPISQDERKIVDKLSSELSKTSINH